MAVVVDASLVTVLVTGDPRNMQARALVDGWIRTYEPLHAPYLLLYEVSNALTRLVAAGLFPSERLVEAWQRVTAVPIAFHSLRQQGGRIVAIAPQLRRKSAYDAAYLALGEQLDAELWTFDGPLAPNASAIGFRVRLVK